MFRSFKQIQEQLIEKANNIEEAQRMINFVLQNDDIPFSSSNLDSYLQHSYPKFYLFEEQQHDSDLLIKATRYYTNTKGENILFFNNSQVRKILPTCRKAVDKYFNNHIVSLKMHREYPSLRVIKDPETDTNSANFTAEIIARIDFSVLFFESTLGIAYGIDQLAFSPKMANARAGYDFRNALIHANEQSKSGIITILTDDFHLKPSAKYDFRNVDYFNFNDCVPDHHISFDWSNIRIMPNVIALIRGITTLYQNTLNEHDDVKLNILYSIADDIADGLTIMIQNPQFLSNHDQRIILLAESEIKKVQVFLRLQSEPLEILNTTVVNVYKANLGNQCHAFLNYEQFTTLFTHLNCDIREQLTLLSPHGEVMEIDYNNPRPVYEILEKQIAFAEANLADFLNTTSQWKLAKKLKMQ